MVPRRRGGVEGGGSGDRPITLGSLITATLLGIGDYVGLHVVFRRTKLSVFPSIIPPQLLGFYKVANTVLLSISEPRVVKFLLTSRDLVLFLLLLNDCISSADHACLV